MDSLSSAARRVPQNNQRQATATTTETPAEEATAVLSLSQQQQQQPRHQHEVFIHKLPRNRIRPADVMRDIIASSTDSLDYSFWLDHASQETTKTAAADDDSSPQESPAISILGSGRQRVEYWGKEKPVGQQGLYVWRNESAKTPESCPDQDILTYLQHEHGQPTMEATLVSFENDNHGAFTMERHSETSLMDLLPFTFRGGHVGYLGYEVRHDTERVLQEQERGGHCHTTNTTATKQQPVASKSDVRVPTAAFLWADRSFVFDHSRQEWYLVAVASSRPDADDDNESSQNEALQWIQDTVEKLDRWTPAPAHHKHSFNGAAPVAATRQGRTTPTAANLVSSLPHQRHRGPTFRPKRTRTTYQRNFQQCMDHIRQGDSYELCLTNQLETLVSRRRREPAQSSTTTTPLDLYNVLRRRNPAPFSAFFNWNSEQRDSSSSSSTESALAICCSSPERFVSVKPVVGATIGAKVNDDNISASSVPPLLQVEAKPIKGTCARVLPPANSHASPLTVMELAAQDQARADSLRASVKDRAENLMIVDLLRNDLSRVCEPGSVHVAKLMDIESFATVHQMVSTIRGTLDPTHTGAVDVLQASFPGGSMTGAPKLRTMELLDEMEEGVCRGPYSGSLGYISLNGSMDMNILIRTAVLTPAGAPSTSTSGSQAAATAAAAVDAQEEEDEKWKVTIGAGGAITALSESEDEYEELMLKASAVMQAVREWASPTAPTTKTNGASSRVPRRSTPSFLEKQLKQQQSTKPHMATNETALMTATRN